MLKTATVNCRWHPYASQRRLGSLELLHFANSILFLDHNYCYSTLKKDFILSYFIFMLLLQSLTYYVGQTLYEVNNIHFLSQSKVVYGITTTVAQNWILWFAVEFTTITEEFQWMNRKKILLLEPYPIWSLPTNVTMKMIPL